MKFRNLLLLHFLFMHTVHAQDILSDIPSGCTSNMATHSRAGSKIDIGPTWVTPCQDVCDLDEDGHVVSKKTLWFPARSCDPEKRRIVANVCVPALNKRGCNEIQQTTESPLSHDCWSNAKNEGEKWECAEKSLPVTCKYKLKGKEERYKNLIKYGYCEPVHK